MRSLKFNAEPHHRLEVGDQVVEGGETFDVSEEQAEVLLSDPQYNVSPGNLRSLKRPEIDELLVKASLDPDDYPSKDAAIAALESPPEVIDEGQSTTDSEETS